MYAHTVETVGLGYQFHPRVLINAFYINELLVRLLPRNDACPKIYASYKNLLADLQAHTEGSEAILRYFELDLLHLLGYGLRLDQEWGTDRCIEGNCYYRLYNEYGFQRYTGVLSPEVRPLVFLGHSLQAFMKKNLNTPAALLDAKRMMRLILQSYLGNKPLKTREFIQKMRVSSGFFSFFI